MTERKYNIYFVVDDECRNESYLCKKSNGRFVFGDQCKMYRFVNQFYFPDLSGAVVKHFKRHNVIFLTDFLSVDRFYEAYSYACFYKSQGKMENQIEIEHVLLVIACDNLSKAVLRYLMDQGYQINVESPGIYFIEKNGDIGSLIIAKKKEMVMVNADPSILKLKALLNPAPLPQISKKVGADVCSPMR